METDTEPAQEDGQREGPRLGMGSGYSSDADRPIVAAATASGGVVGRTHSEEPMESPSNPRLQDAAPAAVGAPEQASGQQSGKKRRIQKPSTRDEPPDAEDQQESADYYIADYMAKLREDIAARGGPALDGWRCEVTFRKTGQQKRPDPMYFSPSGRRCRSRIEVLKALGLVEGGSQPKSVSKSPKVPKPSKASGGGAPKKDKLSRQDAMEHARHALEHLALPYKAASGVTITSLGSFDPRPAYRSRLHIFPVGLTAEIADPAAGQFTSVIRDGGASGPDFVVLLSKDSGPPQEIASGKSPNAAWDQVAALQAETAAGQQQPAVSKQGTGPSSGAQPAEAVRPPVAGSQEAGTASVAGPPVVSQPAEIHLASSRQHAGNGPPADPPASAQHAAGIAARVAPEKAANEAGGGSAGGEPGGEAAVEPGPPLPNGATAGAASNDAAAPEAGDGKPAAEPEPTRLAAEPPVPEQTAAEAQPLPQAEQAKDGAEAEPGGAAVEPGLSSKAAVASLVDAVHIDSKPGIERFGLNSEPLLKAIEGLSGVSECEGYVYVEEQRQWQSHMTLVRKDYRPPTTADKEAGKELRKPVQKSSKMKVDNDQPRITDFLNGAGPSSKQSGSKRKRDSGPETKAKSSKQKTAKSVVQDVVDNLIHNVEVAEGKQARQRDRNEKKQAQQAERAEKKAAEKAEKERQKKAAAEAEQQRRMEEAEQRRKALAEGAEDSELPGAERPPPAPKPVPCTAQLLPADLPGVLEVWEFLGRFSGVLQLAEVPSLSELATAMAKPGPDSRDPFNSAMAALTDVVASEAFDAALNVALDANDDIKPRETEAAAPAVQDWSWPEVARRLFCLAAVGHLVQAARDGSLSGGLDVALGPLVGSSPLGALGPGLINQGLAAGSLPANPCFTAAALPLGACTTAAAAVNARIDAAALKAAEHRLCSKTSSGAATTKAETVTMCRLLLRHLRAVKGPKDANGLLSRPTILFFDGDKAAIAAKQARPLDLHTISLRNDSGLYACMEDGIKVFAADVHYVCDLFQAASKNRKSDFARTLLEKRAPQVADLARVMLSQLLPAAENGSLQAPNGKPGKRSKAPSREASAELQGEETGQPAAAQDDEDLAQPLILGEGCCVCWGDDDRGRLLICDGCEEEYHTYCLDPPLPQLPTNSEEWFCPVCQAEEEGRPPEPLFRRSFGQHRIADSGDAYSSAASLLGAKEYADLSPSERVSVSVLVAALAEGCATVRDHLSEDETQKKDLRKELIELRAKVKRDNVEREEREKAEKESAKPSSKIRSGDASASDLPRPRTRAEEAVEAETAADQVRIREILGQLQMQANGTRREAIGHDRHWNRYWILGSFGPDEQGTLFVELSGQKVSAEAVESKPGLAETEAGGAACGVPEWGCYPDTQPMDELLSYLNPKGKRERALQKAVQKHRDQLCRAGLPWIGNGNMPGAGTPAENGPLPGGDFEPAAEGGGPVAAAKPAEEGGQPGPPGDAAMPDAGAAAVGLPPQREEEPRPTAAMVIDGPQPDHDLEIEAAGNGVAEDGEASEFDSLRSSLLTFVEGLDVEALEPARGSVARLKQWRHLVDAATEPQELMAGLVLAEGFLPAARLKPWWRLWAFPAPLVSTGGLTAVRLRLSALQSALRKGPVAALRGGHGATAVAGDSAAGDGAAGRYPLRERRATKGALAEAMLMRNLGNTTSEEDEPDDEALARAIHKSLNGNPRDARAALRARSRPAAQESNGMRNTRAAAKMGSYSERQVPETRSTRSRPGLDLFRVLVTGGNGAEAMQPLSLEADEEEEVEDEQPFETSDTAAEDGLQEEAGGEPSEQQQTVAVAGRKRLRKATG